ncbi:TPA: NTP transferase domain-containing protein [Providencia rettgeri]|uniref:nucleotidyltransferase family protein n=1 Tax=Providencia sp. Me31A TaxID=3392637 RepID=UPI0038C92675
MKIGILIVAAGKSERYQQAGGNGNKLNSVLVKHSIFEETLINSIASGLSIHVVTRPDNEGVIHSCLQSNIPFSTLESQGLGDSIAYGVRKTASWDGWLIHLADMPYVRSETILHVANELKKYPLVRPYYHGQIGHPVGISARYIDELISLTGDDGAKSILRNRTIHQIEINDNSVINDIDYPITVSK